MTANRASHPSGISAEAQYGDRNGGVAFDSKIWIRLADACRRFAAAGLAHSQTPEDEKKHVLREVGLGALAAQSAVPISRARDKCLVLPPVPEADDSVGPDGMSEPLRRCEVIEFHPLADLALGWTVARYRWTSAKSAGDPSPRSLPSDVKTAEEVVLFDTPTPGKVRPIWHDRFATGEDAVWRSVTLEGAPARRRLDAAQRHVLRERHRRLRTGIPQTQSESDLDRDPAGVVRPIAIRFLGPHPPRQPDRSS